MDQAADACGSSGRTAGHDAHLALPYAGGRHLAGRPPDDGILCAHQISSQL